MLYCITGWGRTYNTQRQPHRTVQNYTSRVNLKKYENFKHFTWRVQATFLNFSLRVTTAEPLFLVAVICTTHTHSFFSFHVELLYFWSVNQSSLIQRF